MTHIDSLRLFIRVVELGSITAGGRDLRMTPAVASNRIRALEQALGIQLFNRTTRKLKPTEAAQLYYEHARRIVDAVEEADAQMAGYAGRPRGTIRVAAPLVAGKTIVGPIIPAFADAYPDIELRVRLTDRTIDVFDDSLDLVFFLGELHDSGLSWAHIADCDRVICAAPSYLARHGTPERPEDLVAHNCLLLRYPRSSEYYWVLTGADGPQKMLVKGSFDADDSGLLLEWALAGAGIVNRPRFEVAADLAAGRLVELLSGHAPPPARFGLLYPHSRMRNPKLKVFVDFAVREAKKAHQRLLSLGAA
ncbi:LysR family transcriptional regulator [Aureimonas altamirensis]|uniref:LysR family transcriptional regulator n=1 Tax=Aureimonas altamirensis TaxID=370622 RepID=UPI001E4B8201|nr:LysR family transcriptional regulator [Aureimonas altamirensis]UHD43994.1 LysR family transcriptional regulator [Aureimonas altamirensis]